MSQNDDFQGLSGDKDCYTVKANLLPPVRGQEKETWIDAPTPEACEAECYARKSGCDAWTFIQSTTQKNRKNYAWNNDKNCYLKSGGLCLNFLSSRRRNS